MPKARDVYDPEEARAANRAVRERRAQPPDILAPWQHERSLGRRIWAAYLWRGYTRRTFGDALGAYYSTVDSWDTEQTEPSVRQLRRVAELLRVPIEELIYGAEGQVAVTPKVQRYEPLTYQHAMEWARQRGAAHAVVVAVGEHVRDLGRRVEVGFVEELVRGLELGVSLEAASERAHEVVLLRRTLELDRYGGAPSATHEDSSALFDAMLDAAAAALLELEERSESPARVLSADEAPLGGGRRKGARRGKSRGGPGDGSGPAQPGG